MYGSEYWLRLEIGVDVAIAYTHDLEAVEAVKVGVQERQGKPWKQWKQDKQ